MYVWVEKSEFALGRVCVKQLHVDCMPGYLSLNYWCVSFLKQKCYCADFVCSVILSCVSIRQDLQSATLNTPRIAVFHHYKPSREEDEDGCKINVFPAFCCYCAAGDLSVSLKRVKIHTQQLLNVSYCYNSITFSDNLYLNPLCQSTSHFFITSATEGGFLTAGVSLFDCWQNNSVMNGF